MQIAEGALVQGLSVLASPRQPEGDSRLTRAEDAFRRGRIQPFSQSREHNGDLLGRGFQPVQGGITSSTECGMASAGLERSGSVQPDHACRPQPGHEPEHQ
jgi:hypothetical protein